MPFFSLSSLLCYFFRNLKDPGVGKTAIAEALAQVLAVPLREIEEKKKMKLPSIPTMNLNPFAKKEKKRRSRSYHLGRRGRYVGI